MDKFLGQDIADARARVMFLRDNADAVEDLGYTKEIPSQELEELKDQLVETNIKLSDLRAAKKEANKEFNDQIHKLEDINEEATALLKSRTEYVTEPCYKFVEGDEVGYYNSEGRLVLTRPARQDERQPRLFARGDFHGDNPYMQTGTDN